MVQYHQLTCPELNACLGTADLGALSQARDICWDTMIGPAFSLLCATGFSQHPRDLPWAQLGQWAGRATMMVGDGAQDHDSVGHPVFNAATTEPDLRWHTSTGTASVHRHPSMTCISRSCWPLLERVTEIRAIIPAAYGGQPSGHTSSVLMVGPVKLDHNAWVLDLSSCASPADEKIHQEYIDSWAPRSCYQRAPMPLQGAPDTIPNASSAGPGGAALWVSLDAQEFVDPAAFGAHDLVDTLRCQPIYGFALSTLFHPHARGGGDLHEDGVLGAVGRWRGDRLALVGPEGILVEGKRWTHADIRQHWRDITGLAQLWTALQNEHTAPHADPYAVASHTRQARTLASSIIVRAFARNGATLPSTVFTVALHPETRVTISSTTAIVPPYASISYDEHRVWMNAQERQALAAFAGTGQAFSYPSTTDRKASQPPVGATSVFTIATNTAHHAMAVLREA